MRVVSVMGLTPIAALGARLTHPQAPAGHTGLAPGQAGGITHSPNPPSAQNRIDIAVKPGAMNQALQGAGANAMNAKPTGVAVGNGGGVRVAPGGVVTGQPTLQGEAKDPAENPVGIINTDPGRAKPAGTVTGTMPTSPGQGNQSNFSPNFSSSFVSMMTALYFSEPDSLRASFSHAVRRNNAHTSHHPTATQQPSPLLAEVFSQLNRQNTLALTSPPASARGGGGLASVMGEADHAALTRMLAASLHDFSSRSAAGFNNPIDSQSLHPQSILSAFGLMHADQLGPDFLAQGVTELMELAQGAGPLEADIILEALAFALLLASLAALAAPNGGRGELALAQSFAAMQLTSQMQDPDAFAQMFSRLGSAERLQLLTLLATLSPSAKLGGLGELDPIACLLKAIAARGGDAQRGDLQSGGANDELSKLMGSRSAGGVGTRTDTAATERLRNEILQFVAAQTSSFYFTETRNQKNFHSARLEAVLQVIVQQLLRELAAKAGGLSKLRCDFADSIELLSSLLDLLTQRDDEESEHSRHHHSDQDDETEDENAPSYDATKSNFSYSQQYAPSLNGHSLSQRSLLAEFTCQTLFRVVPDAENDDKVSFRWEDFRADPISHLPRQLVQPSLGHTELQRLNKYAIDTSVAQANDQSYSILSELLVPSDAAYALGATAAGATIMAKHWHCKMWAHDLAYRLNKAESSVDSIATSDDISASDMQLTAPFDFTTFADKKMANEKAVLPRTEIAMRHDLLRMLENSQDRWVREQAATALAAGIQKLKKNANAMVESKGEQVRTLRSPILRDATIYFLSRYYFKLSANG